MCEWHVAATDGVVLATEKKQKSILYDEKTIHKVEQITQNVGMVYSGMGPDYRFTYYIFMSLMVPSLLLIDKRYRHCRLLFVMSYAICSTPK